MRESSVPLALVHVHLDALGGIAGDMFVAAMVDAWPEFEEPLGAALGRIDLPQGVTAASVAHTDEVLVGRRFAVARVNGPGHDHDHRPDNHEHREFRHIRSMLSSLGLQPQVRERAIAIFGLLAEAEAQVHGVGPDEVTFHEVGAWDSIVDIVAAAVLIDLCGESTWSVSPLPLGSGRVLTAHGVLPVPAPATTILLRGLPVIDDGVGGERVTPTGAAIVKHLDPTPAPPSMPVLMGRTGIGFGSATLPGVPNILRLMAFDEVTPASTGTIGVVRFEVDDQSAEDMAVGLENLRGREDVLDVVQSPVYGKKGRMATHIQVLTVPAAIDDVIDACFRETTTIGVRFGLENRMVLDRHIETLGDGGPRVKTTARPGGVSVKAEMDDLADAGDHLARVRRRSDVEEAVGPGSAGRGRRHGEKDPSS